MSSSTVKWGVNYAEVTSASNSEVGSGERRLPPVVLDLFAFLFGEASPDADVLPGGKCPSQTPRPHTAVVADLFGRFDLFEGRPSRPDWEEDVGIVNLAAGSVVAPVACSG